MYAAAGRAYPPQRRKTREGLEAVDWVRVHAQSLERCQPRQRREVAYLIVWETQTFQMHQPGERAKVFGNYSAPGLR